MDQYPFKSLDVPTTREPLPQQIVDRWVQPLYMGLNQRDTNAARNAAFDLLAELWTDMTEDVAHALLRHADWRTRIVGAHIAACRELRGLTGWIGRLLLRSDVCYAGRGYCVALARFNTSESTDFLLEYLNYSLTRSDLWYDQAEAMAAIAYLDGCNGTCDLASMTTRWETFVADKPNWDLDEAIAAFARRMAQVNSLSSRCIGTAT
jgi:hypothetical protein